MKKVRTILITGGHITPALAVIEEIQRKYPAWNICLVGRMYSLEREKVMSEESRLAGRYKIRFFEIQAGKFPRYGICAMVRSLPRIPKGIMQAYRIIQREKPDIILSFGGYIGLAVVLAGRLRGVPVITHEQTRIPGLANRIISLIAHETLVSFRDTRNGFARNRTHYTGLPIRKDIFATPKVPFAVPADMPVLIVLGGSTGSQFINMLVWSALSDLTNRFVVIHQVGRLSIHDARSYKQSLTASRKDRYIPVAYLDIDAYAWVMHRSSVVVSRAGANTVMELAALGKIAILIPLPWAAGNEQHHNAKWLSQAGSAIILSQNHATSGSLIETLARVNANKSNMTDCAVRLQKTVSLNAASLIVTRIAKILV